MNKIWTYNLGEWICREYKEIGLSDWIGDFDDFLKENKFDIEPVFLKGDEHYGFGMKIYERHEATGSWIVSVDSTNWCRLIFIANLPSLLFFLKEFFPLAEKKQYEFIKDSNGNFINKNKISSIFIVSHKNKDLWEFTLKCYNNEGEETVLLHRENREFLDLYIKENLNMEPF